MKLHVLCANECRKSGASMEIWAIDKYKKRLIAKTNRLNCDSEYEREVFEEMNLEWDSKCDILVIVPEFCLNKKITLNSNTVSIGFIIKSSGNGDNPYIYIQENTKPLVRN